MIATWMVYAALIGALVSVAALALERVAGALRIPMRFVWLASMALSLLWPLAAAARHLMPSTEAPVRMMPFMITMEPVRAIAEGSATATAAVVIDRALISLWVALSLGLVFRLGLALDALAKRRRNWRSARVDGMSVCLSDNVGPAVVGLRSMDVVIPEWIMTLDTPLRAIVLRHEEEHRAARDPHLLFMAAIAIALMPWNIALWIQARRLRLAIELDCDARVLRAHPSPERYGMLMLTIAQRRSIAPPVFAPMLSEPTSQLERRIIAMRASTPQVARLTVIGGTFVAAAALLFACALQADNPTAPRALSTKQVSYNPNQTYFEFQVTKQVQPIAGGALPRYPDMLRSANVEGEVLAQFVVDALGHADMSRFKVLKSTHDMFTASVRSVLPLMQFSPAELNGRKVKQLVQMPFQFSLSRGDATLGQLRTVTKEEVKGSARSAPVRDGRSTHGRPTPVSENQTYFEFQVEQQVSVKPDNLRPRYPDTLRAANVEGEVLAQFVVDTTGTPDVSTFKVLKSTDPAFSDAVLAALPNTRFFPALVGGRPVKQLVQMPFQFNLSK